MSRISSHLPLGPTRDPRSQPLDFHENHGERESDRDVQGDIHAPTVRWIFFFVAFEILCQLLLLFPQTAPLRIPLRIGAFGLSVLYIFLLPHRVGARLHPATGCLLAAVASLLLSSVNPEAGTLAAGLATIVQYIAIAGPILWVAGLQLTMEDLHRVFLLMWGFASLSAAVGTLQTLRPDWTFLQPNLSSVIQNMADSGEGLKVELASGGQVFRPMGLTDQPGGAASAGLTVLVFGMALLIRHRHPGMWTLVISSMILGLFCIYVSLVRSLLIMSGVCVASMVICFAINGEYHRIHKPILALAGAAFVGTIMALIVGGDTIRDRLATLVADDPGAVYYENRGHFFEDTVFDTIPKYPLGAGVGRWGMLNYYFGQSDPREPLWAEIMWTAWVYDGGLPLMFAYASAVALAIWQAWKFSRYRDSADVRLWAAVLFAFNVGALAITFNYPFFMSQGGMDFWLLNAAAFAAITQHAASVRRQTPQRHFGNHSAAPVRPLPNSLLGMNG